MQSCPACGTESPDGFRLCGMCGAALMRAETREERTVVSVRRCEAVLPASA